MILAATMMSVVLYLDRNCVSIAADYIRADLRISQADMAAFLSVFFWSYALGQVPSGWLSDRYGARIMLVIYIVAWSVFTALVGAVTSLAMLLVMRFGIGLGQAGAYPTAGGMISRWVPLNRRAMASGVVAVGGRVGGALAAKLTVFTMVLFSLLGPPAFQPRELQDGPLLCDLLAPATPADGGQGQSIQPLAAKRGVVFAALSEPAQALIVREAARTRAANAAVAKISKLLAGSPQPSDDDKRELREAHEARSALKLTDADEAILLAELNRLLDLPDFYRNVGGADAASNDRQTTENSSGDHLRRLNREALEKALPGGVNELVGRGWRPTMFLYGGIGLVVALVFWLVVRNRPDEHPLCNSAELALIQEGRPPSAGIEKPSPLPLAALLTSSSMWLNCLMQIGTNIGWVFLVTWFPRYLEQVHKVPFSMRGNLQTIALLVGIAGMLFGGWFTDWLTRKLGLRWGRGLPLTATRFTAAAAFLACVAFGTIGANTPFNSAAAFTVAISIVAFSTDLGNPAVWAFCQDVGGRNVGSVLGWGNMWGNLGAGMAPYIYNYFLGENPTIDDWNRMFLACAGAFIVSGICALGVNSTRPLVVEKQSAA